jgi:large subunit ribosomal protein L22
MEVKAIGKYVRVQPRKVRIIADEVRGKDASHTVALLRYHPSKGARALHQVLVSAMANAQENFNLSIDALRIAEIRVDEGPRLKRLRARAMGRGNRIIKKTSHITVVVEDYEPAEKVKPHGSKPKPRPTFAAPKPTGKKAKAEAGKPVEEAKVEAIDETVATEPVEPNPAKKAKAKSKKEVIANESTPEVGAEEKGAE